MIRESSPRVAPTPTVLGLDLGAKSVGWALIRGPETGAPEIIAMGVRVFEAGVDGDIESGQDSSRAAARRLARQLRRQTFRRVQRKRRLFSLLQQAGMFPSGLATDAVARDRFIKELDKRLLTTLPATYGDAGSTAQKLPYVLRAEALKRALLPDELGRVFYHLGERRGFKSNRRTDRQSDEASVVKEGIANLQEAKGGRTLGEHFAHLDPTTDRVRGRYVGRSDYVDEFDRILEAQKCHHGFLTPRFCRQLRRCLFWQRPLRSQKSLIGKCSLLSTRRRCPMAHPLAQEFRLLQAVNHLSVIDSDGQPRVLTAGERNNLLAALRSQGDLTFAAVCKLLGLKRKSTRFNLEEGGEKKLPGNRTHKAMLDAIGDDWLTLEPADQARLVGIVRGSVDEAALRGQLAAALPDLAPRAAALEKVSLEDKPAAHCKKVLADLIDRMRDGIPYATARADFEAQHNLGSPTDPVDQLPPLRTFLPALTNPAVIRALTELRKVINEVIRLYGKPDMVRIELARDLKKPRHLRQKLSAKMRQRESERSVALQNLRSHGIANPSRMDIEKILLAEECGWVCPYTGQGFGMGDLVGDHPKIDVEHIFPRRYLDDSFANKTLCLATENRSVKKDRLPSTAYGGNADRYREILSRVRAFNSELAEEKLRRFMATEVDSDFASRQLVDTAYTSREAAKYVGLLYGGVVDLRSDRRVRTSTGRLTGLLRSTWRLNTILGTEESHKGRDLDHRHHAIDALVVALSTDSIIKAVTDSASSYTQRSSGNWRLDVPEQEGLLEAAAEAVKDVVVSHRVDRRLAGRLHEDSIYSPPRVDVNGNSYHVIRKPLVALTSANITGEDIVDPRVRRAVQETYKALVEQTGKTKPADVFAADRNLPTLPNRNGPPVPIRKVRIRVRSRAIRIGDEAHRARHIMRDPDGLHHTLITAVRSKSGEAWKEEPTSRLEVQDRKRRDEPVVKKDVGADATVVMHLCKGDSVELDTAGGGRAIYVVRGVAATDIGVVLHWDARASNREADNRIRSATKLQARHPRPVIVTPAGRVFNRGG